MASLTLKHVDRAFPNGYEAVKDLNFQIEDGEFVILTGPSGSGKSAVMRMIAGLDEVKNGEIWIGDKLVNSLPPEERGICYDFSELYCVSTNDSSGKCRTGLKTSRHR